MADGKLSMEELLFDHLLKGSKLIEKWCPACHSPLLKKGVTPALPSPALNVTENSTFDSEVTEQQEGNLQWTPTEGIPYCIACEAHVVTNVYELAYAAEQMHSQMHKKGTLLNLMDASRSNSPIKSPTKGSGGKPRLSIFTDSMPLNEQSTLAANEETGIAEEANPHVKFTDIQQVKALLMPNMQSRADVSTVNEEPFSPLSVSGSEQGEQEEFDRTPPVDETSPIVAEEETVEELTEDTRDSPAGVTEEAEQGQEMQDSLAVVVEKTVDELTNETHSSLALEESSNDDAKVACDDDDAIVVDQSTRTLIEVPAAPSAPKAPQTPSSIDYKKRRAIATKVLARKMCAGYSIKEIACDDCGMPLMEKNASIVCVVCPALTESLEAGKEVNLSVELRVVKSVEKNQISEELSIKREQERKASEERMRAEEEARLEALAKKQAAEEKEGAEEKAEMEKLLATLEELEAQIEGQPEQHIAETDESLELEWTKTLGEESRIQEGRVLASEKKRFEGEENSRKKEEEQELSQKILDGIHNMWAEESTLWLQMEEQSLQEESQKRAQAEQHLQRLMAIEKEEAQRLKQLEYIAAENSERERIATEEKTRRNKEQAAKKDEAQKLRQEQEAANERMEQDQQSIAEDKKKLQTVSVEGSWLEEMRAFTQRARKIEQAASVHVQVDDKAMTKAMQVQAKNDTAAEEERLEREEARRLKKEKAMQDKATIEKARQERLEATRRRVEENARAEALLMTKLEEDAAAAKIAIEKAKRASTPQGSILLSSFFCAESPIKADEGDEKKVVVDMWESKRRKARASIGSRTTQGWKNTEFTCLGVECVATPLLSFRNSSPYCIVCGGCGSGKDGEYKKGVKSIPSVTPSRLSKQGNFTPTCTEIIPRLLECVTVQPFIVQPKVRLNNNNEPTVFPLIESLLIEAQEQTKPVVDESIVGKESIEAMEPEPCENSNSTYEKLLPETREVSETSVKRIETPETGVQGTFLCETSVAETRDAVEEFIMANDERPSRKISKLMLVGWSLLDSSCPKCDLLLVSENPGAPELCVTCDDEAFRKAGVLNADINVFLATPSNFDSGNRAPQQQEREDGEQGREDCGNARRREIVEYSTPTRGFPPRTTTPSLLRGTTTAEMLDLFEVKDSNTAPAAIKSATPRLGARTPSRVRPHFFDDCSAERSNDKFYKLTSAQKLVSSSSPASNTLASIMGKISDAKSKLNYFDDMVDKPMSDQIEIAGRIEKLVAAAVSSLEK